jgi:hypothetical protein
MKETQHQSLGSGAPSQSGDLGQTTTEREEANAASQAEASAGHASENLSQRERTPRR